MGRVDVTYLVVLDREHDEAVGVLLEEGLSGLKLLDGRGSLGGKSLLSGLLDGVDGLDLGRHVFLAGRPEVKLLSGGVAHLEVLEGGSSLRKGNC